MVLEAMISEIPGNLLSSEGEYMFYLRYLTPDGEKTPSAIRYPHADQRLIEKYGMMTLPTPSQYNCQSFLRLTDA